jgi:uncharacterized membrane protein
MMTEQEQKIWDEAWEQGRKYGVEDGKREMRYTKFIRPLMRYVLMGLMVALGVIFGVFSVACMCGLFVDAVIGFIALLIGGILCGVAWAVFVYFVKECQ